MTATEPADAMLGAILIDGVKDGACGAPATRVSAQPEPQIRLYGSQTAVDATTPHPWASSPAWRRKRRRSALGDAIMRRSGAGARPGADVQRPQTGRNRIRVHAMTAETTKAWNPAAPPSMTRDLTVREDAAILRVSDLTVREAAAILRVSERTVARWAAAGHIRAWRGGRAWRIPATEITRIRGEA